jgi:HAD superfamily hydrolase (TIGR01549 family)
VTTRRWVCLDIGETLIDETRVWSTWAEVLGVPAFTLMGTLGGVVAAGGDHRDAFPAVGRPEWRDHEGEVARRFGGFRADDLYPDALPALAALAAAGFGVAVMGNQPASRSAELRALGVEVDVLAMSEEIGASKPAPAFFAAVLERLGRPQPGMVAYVGDRVDNDVVPAAGAGMRAVWLRRGPWGRLQTDPGGAAHLVVDTLGELAERITEAFP